MSENINRKLTAEDFQFVQVDGKLYDLYLDDACATEKLDGTSVSHTGTFNAANATAENTVMKIDCKPID